MLVENLPRVRVVKRLGKPQPFRHFADYPPVVAGLTWGRQHAPLARNTPLGVSHGAIFFRPPRGWQHNVGIRQQIGMGSALGNNHQRALFQRSAHPRGIGQADGGIGGHHPQRFYFATLDGLKQLHCFITGPFRQDRCKAVGSPKAAD